MDARSPSIGSAVAASAQASSVVVAAQAAEEKSRMLRYLIAILIASQSVALADDIYIFTREGCGPCERLKTAIASDPTLTDGCVVYLVDTQKHPLIAARRRVSAVPVVILERDGREVGRQVGFRDASELRRWIQEKKK